MNEQVPTNTDMLPDVQEKPKTALISSIVAMYNHRENHFPIGDRSESAEEKAERVYRAIRKTFIEKTGYAITKEDLFNLVSRYVEALESMREKGTDVDPELEKEYQFVVSMAQAMHFNGYDVLALSEDLKVS